MKVLEEIKQLYPYLDIVELSYGDIQVTRTFADGSLYRTLCRVERFTSVSEFKKSLPAGNRFGISVFIDEPAYIIFFKKIRYYFYFPWRFWNSRKTPNL